MNAELVFVRLLVNGDAAAWREFHLRHGRAVKRTISSITRRFVLLVGDDDVNEIYATVCVRLLESEKRKLRSFDPERGRSLKSWLGMLAAQATYDLLRRRRYALRREHDAGLGLIAAAEDPFERCWARQRAEIAESLRGRLGARDREFLDLFLKDHDPEEIAAEMGISLATVYAKKHKLSRRLSQLVHQRDLAA
jgi:RNA polymerase sigma factor (sigma-70 family)